MVTRLYLASGKDFLEDQRRFAPMTLQTINLEGTMIVRQGRRQFLLPEKRYKENSGWLEFKCPRARPTKMLPIRLDEVNWMNRLLQEVCPRICVDEFLGNLQELIAKVALGNRDYWPEVFRVESVFGPDPECTIELGGWNRDHWVYSRFSTLRSYPNFSRWQREKMIAADIDQMPSPLAKEVMLTLWRFAQRCADDAQQGRLYGLGRRSLAKGVHNETAWMDPQIFG